VHVGIKIPNWGPLASTDALVRTAVAADERGLGSVWVSDHVAVPRAPLADYPYSASATPPFDPSTAFVEAFVALAHVAAVTRSIQLGTGVLVLPLRHPILTAKQTASLDVVAGGRLVLGVGVGWLADEFAALGEPFAERGRRTDEAIGVLRAAWAGEDVPLREQGGRPASLGMQPLPRRGAGIPVLVGGHSAAALRRAAALGDGWYGSNLSAAEFGELARTLRALPGADGLSVGARPGVVAASEAADAVSAFRAAGADYVVLDAPYAAMTGDEAVAWVHGVADAIDPSEGGTPLRARDRDQPAASDG
jgi:probable F420-dependent oxidoreductase